MSVPQFHLRHAAEWMARAPEFLRAEMPTLGGNVVRFPTERVQRGKTLR